MRVNRKRGINIEHLDSDDNIINILYDVDDTLNNLNDYVFDKLGLPVAKKFIIRDCDEYTKEQQDKILEMYGDSETFKHLTYEDGAKDICNIESTGIARVWIRSRNFNEGVAKVKKESLLREIPNITESRIQLEIGCGNEKGIMEEADIVIEDCLENLLKYGKHVYKILINKSYNQIRSCKQSDWTLGIVRVSSLREAVTLVDKLIRRT